MAALAGGDTKVDAVIEKYRDDLQKKRTIDLGNAARTSGKADFFVLLGRNQDSSPTAQSVAFIDGDESLKSLSGRLQSLRYNQKFPDDAPVKILRRGTLSCKADADCAFQLALPDDVRSVD